MSKSQKKNDKLLHKRRKVKEKQVLPNDQLNKDINFLKEKAEKGNLKIVDRSLIGSKEKISTILIEMIKPILYTAMDEEDARGILSLGVAAWNCGIIKQNMGEEILKDVMKEFKSGESGEERKLLDEYIKIKCSKFSQYNDFITDFKISFERDGRMNFTVLTGITKDTSKSLNT